MEAKIKCSNCGAEITNLNLSWGKRQWLWSLLCFVPLLLFLVFGRYLLFGRHQVEYTRDLQATVQESRMNDEEIKILGKITNSGSIVWDNVTIEVELYDEDLRFLGEASTYLSGSIHPGAEENVSISVVKPHPDMNAIPPKIVLKVTGARSHPF
jgi:hypothetical protein